MLSYSSRDTKVWSTKGVEGVHRFLARAWRLIVGLPSLSGSYQQGSIVTENEPSFEQLRALHQCIRKVTEEVEGMRFNTAIAAMMEFINIANKWDHRPRTVIESFILLLSPFAPHLAEELWQRTGHHETLAYEPWPKVVEEYVAEDLVTLPIQINGKTRGTVQVSIDADETTVVGTVLNDGKLSKFIGDKSVIKKIYVPGKILNIVLSK